MRLIWGVMSLLVVLAIVGALGKTQLAALGLGGQGATRAAALPGAATLPADATVPAQAKAIQSAVRDAANAALQQGAKRVDEPPSQ
jgi:hypothetical protein